MKRRTTSILASIPGAREALKRINNEALRRNAEDDDATLARFERTLDKAFDRPPTFPLHVFPSFVRQYLKACSKSIHCPIDLLAVPLLSIAGAATGRSGRRLKVKEGWQVSSCLWAACMLASSGGKTPALNAVQNFFDDKQEAEYQSYMERKAAFDEDPENNPHPGPFPSLKLTDTTIESLRSDLMAGPALFTRDELGGWCHQMGQYKSGNADRFDWCSFWSHSSINIGRKSERVYVKDPFVAVTGMMVPASARELNYRGQGDDGFVHRMLLSNPESMPPVATLAGVPKKLTQDYKSRMAKLFDPPGESERTTLTFAPDAIRMILNWANCELYYDLKPLTNPGYVAPDWLVSKYRKLFENALRLCLVLHEIWRVAGNKHVPEEWEPHPREFYGRRIEWQDSVVDCLTVERAILVVQYFRAHIPSIQSLFVVSELDDVDRHYQRLQDLGSITVRELTHRTSWKTRDQVMAVFTEWQRRGYGKIQSTRSNQTTFVFGASS